MRFTHKTMLSQYEAMPFSVIVSLFHQNTIKL